MKAVHYEFDKIQEERSYILQQVQGRKLTDIYHSHDFYEWNIVREGSCTQLINEKDYPLEKNDVVLFRPGDRHMFISQSEGVELWSLSVKKEEFEILSNAYYPALKEEINAADTPPVFRQSGVPMQSGQGEYDCKLLLFSLLKMYIDRSRQSVPQQLAAAMTELQKAENLREGVAAFVRLSHYSQSHLSRLMQKHLHIGLQEYVMNLRLEAAYNQLLLSGEEIEEIAEKLGYASFSHFHKIFKKKYGITPAALRKHHGYPIT